MHLYLYILAIIASILLGNHICLLNQVRYPSAFALHFENDIAICAVRLKIETTERDLPISNHFIWTRSASQKSLHWCGVDFNGVESHLQIPVFFIRFPLFEWLVHRIQGSLHAIPHTSIVLTSALSWKYYPIEKCRNWLLHISTPFDQNFTVPHVRQAAKKRHFLQMTPAIVTLVWHRSCSLVSGKTWSSSFLSSRFTVTPLSSTRHVWSMDWSVALRRINLTWI